MEITTKKVLGLQLPTDPRWVDMATLSIGDILTDHAWCEQKAATTCISLIVQYSYLPELVARLSPVVTEEWGHFRMVLRELSQRGLPLGQQRKDEYVNRLLACIRNGKRDEQLMDKLLASAMIEARSCERFRLLSLVLEELPLKTFYHDLMVAEASHYRMFLELAGELTGKEATQIRWNEWLEMEARVMETLEVRGDRIH